MTAFSAADPPKRLGAVVLHGMGTPKTRTTHDGGMPLAQPQKMANAIARRLGKLGHDPHQIAWEAVHWHPITGASQDALLGRLRAGGTRWSVGRKFALAGLGDAGAYLYNAGKPDSIYAEIHALIHEAVDKVAARLVNPDCPLVFFANSLGGIMMTDYIWDRTRKVLAGGHDPLGPTEFHRLVTLRRIFTFGCNIPLFVHAFERICVRLPHADTEWHNFYDRDDVLGYPLAELGGEYAELAQSRRLFDHPMSSGPFPASLTPWSHNYYWTAGGFVRPVAEQLARLL